MKFQRFMLLNMLFVVWFVLASIVAVLPELVGVSSDAPRLPDAVRLASETESLSQIQYARVSLPEIVVEESQEFKLISLALPVEKSLQPNPKPKIEVQKQVVLSKRYKAFAKGFKRKNLLEPADPVEDVAEEELVEDEGFSKRKLSAALVYLRDYQTDEGDWKAESWWPEVREGAFSNDRETSHETEFGWESDTVANTSLALLAYLSAGWDHTDGPFQVTCRKAVKYLRRVQQSDGRFSEEIKHHCFAVMAMAEAYGLSGTAILKPLADKGIDYLLKQQHADGGFGDGDESNVLDSCYAVLAIKGALMSGLEVDKTVSKRGFDFIESMREGDHVRYSAFREYPVQAGNATEASFPTCEAAWILSGLISNKLNVRHKTVRSMADRLVEKQNLPNWKANNIDCEYYWLASLALFQADGGYRKKGPHWGTWTRALSSQLLDRQRGFTEYDKESDLYSAKELLEHGSWDPAGVNGPRYGRVYTTSMCFLSLDRACGYYYMRAGPRAKDESSEDERIIEDDEDDEDPSDSPNGDLAPNPDESDSDGGPRPNRNSSRERGSNR